MLGVRLWWGSREASRGVNNGEPVQGRGLRDPLLSPLEEPWPSATISPGAGTEGSFSWRFIRTADRLLFETGDWGVWVGEPIDDPSSPNLSEKRFDRVA